MKPAEKKSKITILLFLWARGGCQYRSLLWATLTGANIRPYRIGNAYTSCNYSKALRQGVFFIAVDP